VDFGFDEIQDMLSKDARRFLGDKCPKTFVREMEEDEAGYSPELWKEMADLGWMGLVIPEEYGGQGMSFMDLAALLEEMGRACLPGPFFSTVVLGGALVLEAGSEEQKKQLLPQIADGEMIMSLALLESSGLYDPERIAMTATPGGDGYMLDGTKLFVTDAHIADTLICAARTEIGISLFLIDAKSPGVNCKLLKTIASDRQCEVTFDRITVPKENLLGELNGGWPVVEKVLMQAAAAKCAEMIGGAQQVLEMVVNYAKERQQFGKPIGSFLPTSPLMLMLRVTLPIRHVWPSAKMRRRINWSAWRRRGSAMRTAALWLSGIKFTVALASLRTMTCNCTSAGPKQERFSSVTAIIIERKLLRRWHCRGEPVETCLKAWGPLR